MTKPGRRLTRKTLWIDEEDIHVLKGILGTKSVSKNEVSGETNAAGVERRYHVKVIIPVFR